MNKNKYKQQFYNEHYERIHLAVPKGMKNTIKVLANQKGMSINSYIQDLIRKDQEGFFDTIQVADKNKELISGITGNMHDGYDIIFKDGYKVHCRTKREARSAIIEYCKKNWCLIGTFFVKSNILHKTVKILHKIPFFLCIACVLFVYYALIFVYFNTLLKKENPLWKHRLFGGCVF